MAHPHESPRPSGQNITALDFMTVFDGNQFPVWPEEQREVGERFNSLFNDAMLNYIDRVDSGPEPSNSHRSTLLLERPDESDPATTWSIELTEAPPPIPVPFLELRRLVLTKYTDGRPGLGALYQQAMDGVVRRFDFGASERGTAIAKLHDGRRPNLGGGGSFADAYVAALGPDIERQTEEMTKTDREQFMKKVLHEIVARRAEMAHGQDGQPVAMSEMIALEDFMGHPDMRVLGED
ncbi:MAG TPA: hypothetical protein VHB72_01015 [Candidatus Saccharimonadales bacterium]|nr:hypothetical protein [Candidatus Saccharimonadales bacterium]